MSSLFILNQATTLLTKRLENCVLTHAGYAKHAQVHCTLRVIGDGSGGPIEWFEAVDGYCKRVDATFLPEPINMVTNAAFLIAAIWALRCPDLPVMGRV